MKTKEPIINYTEPKTAASFMQFRPQRRISVAENIAGDIEIKDASGQILLTIPKTSRDEVASFIQL